MHPVTHPATQPAARAAKAVASLLRRRPILRVQLTLLYSGLALGLLAAVLLATHLLYGHSEQRAPAGTPPGTGDGGHGFDVGPAVIGLGAAAVALAGAWWLAGRFLRPLRVITTTAREISATNLDRRLDLGGPADELTDLSRTLNDLFGRLQAAFEAQRHFVANASHELRTPLAGQRAVLQVALADPAADAASLRAAGEAALDLGDRQERLIAALLTLATGEQGVERWDPVDLAATARDVLAGHRHEADRRGIRIDARLAPAPTAGDPRLVASLITNLVDNAVRHNVAGGRVTVSTGTAAAEAADQPGRTDEADQAGQAERPTQPSRTDVADQSGHVTFAISNTGPPVARQDLERLFRPFQQAGPQRVHREGHGLGLAIVRAIAAAHGAEVTSRPGADGGLTVQVRFPRKQGSYEA